VGAYQPEPPLLLQEEVSFVAADVVGKGIETAAYNNSEASEILYLIRPERSAALHLERTYMDDPGSPSGSRDKVTCNKLSVPHRTKHGSRNNYNSVRLALAAMPVPEAPDSMPIHGLQTFSIKSGRVAKLISSKQFSFGWWNDLFVIDLDGDGLLEVLLSGGMGTGYSSIFIFTLKTDGTLVPHSIPEELGDRDEPGQIATDRGYFGLADFDDDGRVDIAVFEGLWHTCYTNDYYVAAYQQDEGKKVWRVMSPYLLPGKTDQREFFAAKAAAIERLAGSGEAMLLYAGYQGEPIPVFVFDGCLFRVQEGLGQGDSSARYNYPELLASEIH
jgi:hypothetical protein